MATSPRARQTFVNDGGSTNTVKDATKTLNSTGTKAGYTVTEDTQKGGTQPSQAYYDKTAKMIANYRAGLNQTPTTTRTVSTSTESSGGGGDYSYSGGSTDDIVNQIKDLLNQQKEQADAYYKTLYEQQTAQNKQAWENNRNQINRNFARGSRYLQNMYGDSMSGAGLSNRARNYQNWQSNLAENQRNYTNNDATALANYNMNRANTASQLAQGWYNYVLPVYTNRQQTLDDYDYRKYLASL